MAIKLPRDANGKEIPLDTKVLYRKDGNKVVINGFDYSEIYSSRHRSLNEQREWRSYTYNSGFRFVQHCEELYLEPPESDSWEKLLEDIGGTTGHTCWYCVYFKNSGQICSGCPAVSTGDCATAVLDDIARRIRALRGEDDD